MIDWKRVGEVLRCPICGDKAHIVAGSDGTEGEHTHHFHISREMAMRLSIPSVEELEATIKDLETKLEQAKALRSMTPPADDRKGDGRE